MGVRKGDFMIMPFGKYKGQNIETQVPRKYLRWLRNNMDLYGTLREGIECVLSGKPAPKYSPEPKTCVFRPSEGESE